MEKPFGHDLASARALNAELHKSPHGKADLPDRYFLGKEPTMDILFLRFTNAVFEPLWNRDHIQSVQITMAEDFGVDDRGASTTRSGRSGTLCRTTCCRSSG